MFPTKHFFQKKKIIKMIDHHSPLRDVMGQSYPIEATPELVLITLVIHRSTLHFAEAQNILLKYYFGTEA